jgi:hypothetical protein
LLFSSLGSQQLYNTDSPLQVNRFIATQQAIPDVPLTKSELRAAEKAAKHAAKDRAKAEKAAAKLAAKEEKLRIKATKRGKGGGVDG